MTREFIVHRYAREQWPFVLGRRPFIVTGPSFTRWARIGCHSNVLRRESFDVLRSSYPPGVVDRTDLDGLAEMFLRDGVVQALWVSSLPSSLPVPERWALSLEQVVREVLTLPLPGQAVDLAEEVSNYVSGALTPEMCRSYVVEDGLQLEALAPPPDEKN